MPNPTRAERKEGTVLRISAKVDYAVRALIEVAAGRRRARSRRARSPRPRTIPARFLGTVLTQLRRSGLVESRRGGDGGYWLARPGSDICVADVIAAMDGEVIDVRALPDPELGHARDVGSDGQQRALAARHLHDRRPGEWQRRQLTPKTGRVARTTVWRRANVSSDKYGGHRDRDHHESTTSRATRGRRRWPLLGVAALLVIVSAACVDPNTNSLLRPDEPVVLTGSQLPSLVGANPNQIVAFAHSRPGGTPTWTQIPVQIDQRKVVDFGQFPGSNATPGVNGTVYGTTPIGVTALQYADANTFVGADSNATFDADDELVVMSADAGGSPNTTERTEPAGVVAGSGVRVQLDRPTRGRSKRRRLSVPDHGRARPVGGSRLRRLRLQPDVGCVQDDLQASRRARTPETSFVTTANYRIGFDDRWIENEWRVDAGAGTGVDILDGVQGAVQPDHLRAQQRHLRRRRGCVHRQHRRSRPGDPLVRRREQRPADPAHASPLSRPRGDNDEPSGARHSRRSWTTPTTAPPPLA